MGYVLEKGWRRKFTGWGWGVRWDNTIECIHVYLYMGLESEKKSGFNEGIGVWGWSVSRGKRASEWG